VPNVGRTDFGTRSKVFKAKNTIITTFNLVPKSVLVTFINRSKVLIMVFFSFKTFDLVKKLQVLFWH
jgi:hypothetical protein